MFSLVRFPGARHTGKYSYVFVIWYPSIYLLSFLFFAIRRVYTGLFTLGGLAEIS